MLEFSSMVKLAPAYSKVCQEIQNPTKNTVGVHNRSYADLDSVINTSKKVLADNGFTVMQMPFNKDGEFGVETMLLHTSGEYIKGSFATKPPSLDPQKIGSQITYYRRYALVSMLNLVGENDDDAESVSDHAKTKANSKPSEKQINKMFFSVKANNCSIDDFNKIIKPNISLVQYNSLMDNFTADRFQLAVKHYKGEK